MRLAECGAPPEINVELGEGAEGEAKGLEAKGEPKGKPKGEAEAEVGPGATAKGEAEAEAGARGEETVALPLPFGLPLEVGGLLGVSDLDKGLDEGMLPEGFLCLPLP